MAAAKKTTAKKAPAKASAKKVVAKKPTAPAKASGAPSRSPATKAAPAARAPAKRAAKAAPTATKAAPATSATKKAPAKKAPGKVAASKKATTTSAATTKAVAPATKAPAKKAPAKKAAKKAAFDAKFLAEQKVLLLEERATYTRQADNLQAEADSLAELREPGDVQFDEESGEGDTLAVERERDLALSARAREQVEEIDRALAKLVAGTYGICEVSGEPIPRARLQAIPQARERVEYKVGGFNRR